MRDTRRRATKEEIDAFFQSDGECWDFTSFALWDNPQFKQIEWNTLRDLEDDVTPAQLTLLALNALDGQVNNGGIEQLFFNYVHDIELIRQQVRRLGWWDLIRRFEEKYVAAFKETPTLGEVARLNRSFQADIRVENDKAKTWANFQKVYDLVEGSDFNDWFFSDEALDGFQGAVKKFAVENQDELFVVVGDR